MVVTLKKREIPEPGSIVVRRNSESLEIPFLIVDPIDEYGVTNNCPLSRHYSTTSILFPLYPEGFVVVAVHDVWSVDSLSLEHGGIVPNEALCVTIASNDNLVSSRVDIVHQL